MEVTFKLDLPKETFEFLKVVAEQAEVPITLVVKELLMRGMNVRKELEDASH